MFELYWNAFATVLLPQNILAICLGGLWGLLAGALPGISTSMGVVLLLSFTYTMSPITAFCMLCAAYCGGITGGSITSILFGIPGEPSAIPTTIEGYALAKQGRAAYALWLFIICSIGGGIFSVLVMMAATPVMANFALRFGPPEFFALVILGLSVVSGLSGGSALKGYLSCFFGLFLATVGTDGITGGERFTFGTTILLGGINFVTAMVGLLAVSEILEEAEQPFQEYKSAVRYKGLRDEMPKLSDYTKHWFLLLRSAVMGTVVGSLPGGGATIVSFLAYGDASRSTKHPEKIGHGSEEGLMAAETANNAATGGSMTILLALGIPGGNTTAMPDIIYGIFAAMLMSNIFLLILTIMSIQLFLQLNRLPYTAFSAAIMVLCVIGAFGMSNSMDDLFVMFAFGVIGYVMRKNKIPIAPAVLGLVLGDLAELALRRSLLLSLGDPMILISRPISLILLLAAVVSVLWPVFKKPKMLEGSENA
jgi:putative tricarboxylic transport membrane protein